MKENGLKMRIEDDPTLPLPVPDGFIIAQCIKVYKCIITIYNIKYNLKRIICYKYRILYIIHNLEDYSLTF